MRAARASVLILSIRGLCSHLVWRVLESKAKLTPPPVRRGVAAMLKVERVPALRLAEAAEQREAPEVRTPSLEERDGAAMVLHRRRATTIAPGETPMPLPRRAMLAAPLLAQSLLAQSLLVRPAGAQTQPFPERPVRYIVPFAPAGLTDIMARLVAQRLGEGWNRPVVVENRAGGNAMIGADAAAKSAPDGHTLLAITLTHAVNVSLFPNAPYDLLRDFTPISVLGSLPLVLAVPAASRHRTLAQFLSAARTDNMNAGSSGNGSPPHLGLELVRRAAGAAGNITHVSYRGGAPAVTDLVAGNLDFIVSNLPECLSQLQAGRLRGLAITGATRHRLVPDIPTVAELGQPGLAMTNWTAMLTNSAVPRPILMEISRATQAAVRDTETRRRAEEGGFDVLAWDPERSLAFMTEEVVRWGRLVREARIVPDA
jgi:tripartite-type tricarboxylate transporter receptor subunit TctC